MPGPRSLVEMCMKVAIENIHLITSLRNMPHQYIHKFLVAVRSAAQLHALEVDSDEDIYEDTPVHWKRIIAKDFPILSAKYNYVPKDPKSWYKVWQKYKTLQDQQDAAATEKLMQSFAAKREERDARRPAILSMQESRKLPRPKPTNLGASGAWYSQPREKKTFLQKTRREVAAETKRFKRTTPTGQLPVLAGQVTKAPAAMLNDARIQLQSNSAPTPVLAPLKKMAPRKMPAGLSGNDEQRRESERFRQENEARLLRIKNPAANKTATPNLVSFSDDESYGPDDVTERDDDLFGDLEPDSSPPKGGALSPESLEEAATSLSRTAFRQSTQPQRGRLSPGYLETTATSLSRTASKQSTKPRRSGLLSAAPGTTSSAAHRVPSHPKASTNSTSPPSGSPPPALPKGPAAPAQTSASPPKPAGLPNLPPVIQRKRKPVDVFMRPNKQARR